MAKYYSELVHLCQVLGLTKIFYCEPGQGHSLKEQDLLTLSDCGRGDQYDAGQGCQGLENI